MHKVEIIHLSHLNISINDIKSQIEDKLNTHGVLYGEIEPSENLEITLSNVSHVIKSVKVNNDVIYAEVEFISNDKGRLAKSLIDNFAYCLSPRIILYTSKIKIITLDVINYSPIRQSLRNGKIEKILN